MRKVLKSRQFVGLTSLVIMTGSVLSGCGSGDSGGGGGGGGDQDPVKIGILAPYTGVFAAYGPKVIEDPIRLFLEQHDNKLGGRDVEVIVEDDQGDPNIALQSARKLVQQDQVDVIIGQVNSAAALAVRDFVDSSKVVTMVTVAGATDLTGKKSSPYVFRSGFANNQFGAAGAALGEDLGIPRIATIAADYVAGREWVEDFVSDWGASGGEIVEQLWPPLGTVDFAPYISQLQALEGKVDAIHPVLFGADGLRFFEQYESYGLDIPIYTNGDVTEQSIFLDHVGEKALGTKVFWDYSPYLDNPVNKKFREAFLKKYDRLPGAFAMQAYAGMMFLDGAIDSLGDGEAANGDTLAKALEKTKIDSPAGPLEFTEGHGLIMNVYLNEVREGPDGIIAQMPLGPMVTGVTQGMSYEEAKKNLKDG